MGRLPSLTPREVIAALKRAGFEQVRQHGSHVILLHQDGRETVVPVHPGDIRRGTLSAILKQAKLSQDEFRGLL